ncbi:MAG TPA: GAF domain-containing protein, partial [Gemmatimonadales bacterium]|nr:GAF domain-containing protein [Gemmatimonadales bacterium]
MAYLETLNQISRVLLIERNRRGVLRLVAEAAARFLHSDTARVALLDADGKALVLEAATGPLEPLVGSAVALDTSMSGWVVQHGQALVLNDPEADGRGFRSLHEKIELRRAATQPLFMRGRCVGALGVDNPRDDRRFEERELELLRELADHTGLVLESIRAVGELAERERRAELLNAVNSRIRQSLDLQTILDAAVRELGMALQASRCFVRLRRGNELLPASSEWHAPEVAASGARPDYALPALVTAMRERRTIETSDARTLPGLSPRAADAEQPLALLATPIVLRGEAIGVVAFHQVGLARLWQREEIGLVQEVAGELAIAVSNARLYRSTEETSRELALKISELERANRMKAQFLANMSHELRTPLNSVIGFSEMLLIGALGPLPEAQRDALETISRNGRHLLGLVNDVLDLSKVEAGRMELHLTQTDVRAVIGDVITGMESLIQAKGHEIQVDLGDAPLLATADEMRVRQILYNLLSNAVKFTAAGGKIAVRAGQRRTPLPVPGGRRVDRDAVWVSVADTGIGITKEDLPRLFTEFTQVDASLSRRFEGTGLGLALCRRFV